jgi:hypothetical protein
MTTLTVGRRSAIAPDIVRAVDHELVYRRCGTEPLQIGHPVDETPAPEVQAGVAENPVP